MTGIAATALVIPMVLGGVSSVHAQTMTANSQPQATTGTVQPQSQTGTTQSQSQNGQNSQSGQNGQAGNSSSNSQPGSAKHPMTMQQFKQMMAKQQKIMQKAQKAQEKKMLKHATPMFVARGKEVYRIMVDVTKKGATPIMDTQKKYTSVKKYHRIAMRKMNQARRMFAAARRIRGRKARKDAIVKANKQFLMYDRLGSMPTQQQLQQQQKQQAAKAQKQQKGQNTNNTSNNNKPNKPVRKHHARRHHARRRHARKHVIRRHGTRKNRARRSRLARRQGRNRRQVRRSRKGSKNSFTLKFTYLKSKYRRGTANQARRSGFATGPTLDQVNTVFDHYRPNSRRAVVPKNYRIQPNNTTWLVGRHTNNINKITHMRQAYYYNGQIHGWSNIGYRK